MVHKGKNVKLLYQLRKNPKLLILTVFFVTTNSIVARILDKRDLKGLYDAVLEDKNHLSPFHGYPWIESDLLQKHYEYGNANVVKDERGIVKKINGKGTDPTMYLILDFFHLVDNVFGYSQVPTKVAKYLSPENIGQIMVIIENLENKEETATKQAQKQIANIMLKSMTPILAAGTKAEQNLKEFGNTAIKTVANMPELEQLSKKKKSKYFNFTQSQWKKSLINLSKESKEEIEKLFESLNLTPEIKQKYNQTIVNMISQFNDKQESVKKHKNVFNFVKGDVGYLARMVIESLKESGHIQRKTPQELRYSRYTTHAIFLSLLYDKAKRMNDFKTYFNQFTPSILKTDAATLLSQRFADIIDETKISNKVDGNWQYKTPDEVKSFFKQNYEQIAYEAIDALHQTIPPLIPWMELTTRGENFANCGAVTLMSFLRIVMSKLGVYKAKTRRFDTENMQQIFENYFKKRGISFDHNKMKKNVVPLVLFLEEFNYGSITSGELFHRKLNSLLFDIPGIKYLRRVKKDQTERLKNNAMPAIHTTTITYGTYQDFDDSWYLLEITGYPSTFVEACNHFFGTTIKTFKELCNLFEFTLDPGENYTVKDINDKQIYDDYYKNNIRSIPKPILTTTINDEEIKIQISLSDGHSSIKLLQERNTDKYEYILDTIILNMHNSFILRNLASLYPFAKQTMWDRAKYLKPEINEQAMLFYLAMTINLSVQQGKANIVSYLVKINKTAPKALLGGLNDKLIASVVSSGDDESAITILEGFTNKDHELTKHSLATMHECVKILNTMSFKKDGCEYLLKTLNVHGWQQIAGQELDNVIEDTKTLFQQQTRENQYRLAENVSKHTEISKNHPKLVPLLDKVLADAPSILSVVENINNTIEAIVTSENNSAKQQEKITMLEKFITQIEHNYELYDILNTTIEREQKSAYIPIIEKILSDQILPSAPKDFRKLRDSIIIIADQYPNIQPELENFFLTLLPYFFKPNNEYRDPTDIDEIDLIYTLGNKIAEKIIEKNYQKAYRNITKFFQGAEKKQISSIYLEKHTELLDFMLKYHHNQKTLNEKRKKLINRCLLLFFAACIKADDLKSTWETNLEPILNAIESFASPDFFEQVGQLENMVNDRKKQLATDIKALEEHAKGDDDIERLKKQLKDLKEIEIPLKQLTKKIREE